MAESRSEYEAQALKDLIEVAVALKKSGMLDLLKALSERSEELMTLMADDITLYRALGLMDAAGSGLDKVDPDDIIDSKQTIEDLTRCTIRSMAEVSRKGVKPVGLTGMLGALRDKDVQVGLGLLIQLAKGLGACYSSRKK
ncbi:MAG: DUF1641 domain-containing protein [Desulfurococcales archaeon]|nr:DUF1641 domain-containing protein [Desulfurococcales archaeon]MCE4605637.1 DUF1641 domain-containing protein [Desulfurococcales archaeon]